MMLKVKMALAAAGFVALLGFLAPTASAEGIPIGAGDHIRLYDGTGGGNGGEFDAVLQQWNGSNYVATTTTWSGFCLETDEYFSPGELLRVAGVTDTAQNGGSNTNSGDTLSYETAWLFTQFWNGSLAGLNSAGDAVSGAYLDSHNDNATHLQNAFWFLEDESLGVDNHYVTLAQDAVTNGWNTLGNVRVLNLERRVNGQWVEAQDQLVMVPEPGTLALFGIGLTALACIRRRRLMLERA